MSASSAAGKNAARWIRPPVVAGHFYPADAATIQVQLQEFTSGASAVGAPANASSASSAVARPVRGAICPHAGWRYSGALAYRTLLRCGPIERVVILAVNHRERNPPAWSIWPEGAWQTPLGDVPVDAGLAAALMAAIPELTASAAPHAQDHATEVLLPMLQQLTTAGAASAGGGGGGGGLQIVPIVPFLPPEDEGAVVEVGRRIGAVVKQWQQQVGPVLVLASNDMTHFAPAAVARVQDRKALERIEALDGLGLLATARRERITMCGAQPVAALLGAAGVLGATRGELVGYTNSGVVSGDESDVVAYAGVVIE